jgi:hypothetical protein
VLTGIPVKTFPDGIIPYQHYVQYFTEGSRNLARILSEKGYTTAAYHNFTRRFWLRDQVYPKLGFGSFTSMDGMDLTIQPNDWPTDEGLYKAVLAKAAGQRAGTRSSTSSSRCRPTGPMSLNPRTPTAMRAE